MLVEAEDICRELQTFGVVVKNAEVIDKMMELCIVYHISADDFVEYWFAFSTSKQLDSEPTIEHLIRLENEELVNKKKRQAVKPEIRANKSINCFVGSTDNVMVDTECLLEAYGTPEVQAAKKRQITPEAAATKKFGTLSGAVGISPSLSSPIFSGSTPPSGKYASRTNAGEVMCEFGTTANVRWDEGPKATQCTIAPFAEHSFVTGRYTYMLAKLRLTSLILNDRIENMAAVLQAKQTGNEFGNVRMPTSEEVTVVGCILCDSNGKLNPSSVLLEGSIQTSAGLAVQLDVGSLPSYSLFPGQIVAFSGVNASGQKFEARSVHPCVALPLPDTLVLYNAEEPLTIMVAAGSYMVSDSLSYDPLHDFLKMVQSQQPHVCILVGPFVDCKHKMIEEGNFPETYDHIFSRCMELILKFAKGFATQYVIVPSSRDVHHEFVYPTPPFSCCKTYKNEKNLHFVSDPSVINISGVVVGITSTDVLLHLGKEEITFPSMPDRLARLASHLLFQHSFYPLYPPAEEVNVEYDKLDSSAKLDVTPHLLILPSDLNCFVKLVSAECDANVATHEGDWPTTFRTPHCTYANLNKYKCLVTRCQCIF